MFLLSIELTLALCHLFFYRHDDAVMNLEAENEKIVSNVFENGRDWDIVFLDEFFLFEQKDTNFLLKP